mmetsp:Transcript_124878/g.388745  ORF Transcript_124878/g.388745 Transcript_124878/m.388745 type:complete len:235 (+) Transcript_124878:229-933(+)
MPRAPLRCPVPSVDDTTEVPFSATVSKRFKRASSSQSTPVAFTLNAIFALWVRLTSIRSCSHCSVNSIRASSLKDSPSSPTLNTIGTAAWPQIESSYLPMYGSFSDHPMLGVMLKDPASRPVTKRPAWRRSRRTLASAKHVLVVTGPIPQSQYKGLDTYAPNCSKDGLKMRLGFSNNPWGSSGTAHALVPLSRKTWTPKAGNSSSSVPFTTGTRRGGSASSNGTRASDEDVPCS